MFIKYCCTLSMIVLIVSDCSTLNLNLNLIRDAVKFNCAHCPNARNNSQGYNAM